MAPKLTINSKVGLRNFSWLCVWHPLVATWRDPNKISNNVLCTLLYIYIARNEDAIPPAGLSLPGLLLPLSNTRPSALRPPRAGGFHLSLQPELEATCQVNCLNKYVQGSYTFWPMDFHDFSTTFPWLLTKFPWPNWNLGIYMNIFENVAYWEHMPAYILSVFL